MRALLVLAMALLGSACADSDALVYDDPREGSAGSVGGIEAQWLSPKESRRVTSRTSLVLSAYTAPPYAPLIAELVRPNAAPLRLQVEGEPGPQQRFSADVELVHGGNVLEVRVREVAGTRGRTLVRRLRYLGEAPALRVYAVVPASTGACTPPDEPTPLPYVVAGTEVCVHVLTSAGDGRVQALRALDGAGGVLPASASELAPGRWALRGTLPPDTLERWRIEALDSQGRRGEVTVELLGVTRGPTLVIDLPSRVPWEVQAASLRLEGEVLPGEAPLARLWAARDGVILAEGSWSGDRWEVDVALRSGDQTIVVWVEDRAGLRDQREARVVRARELRLTPPVTRPEDRVRVVLDRFALTSLIPEADRAGLELLEVSLVPLVREALRAVREASAADRQRWGQAERNLHELLTATPDTANLRGTSLEDLGDLSLALGVAPPRMLGDLLALGVTEPLLDLDQSAEVVAELLLGSHPGVDLSPEGEPVLRITLADLLDDLRSLGARLGPVEGHPGVVEGEVVAAVLEAGFAMELLVRSNLEEQTCVDLQRRTLDWLYVRGPGPALEADFLDPEGFRVVGVRDEPTVDLRMVLRSSERFQPAGRARESRPVQGRPGFFYGDGPLFDLPLWTLERVLVEIAFRQLVDLHRAEGWQREVRYDVGSIQPAALLRWDRGWVDIWTAGGLGSPPPPSYIWQGLAEIAQVRLRDNVAAEGVIDVAFTLRDVPVGLDADALMERLRPSLQTQQETIARLLVGEIGVRPAPCEVVWVRRGQVLALTYRGPQGPGAGLYVDPGLTQPAGSAALAGDHPLGAAGVVVPREGQRLYARTREGALVSIDVLGTPPNIALRVLAAEEVR